MIFPTEMQAQIVHTKAEIVLRKGSQGVLPCRAEKEAAALYWYKGPTLKTATLLLLTLRYENVWEKEITAEFRGLYDINDNFSLVINSTRIHDNDYFFCDILDPESGTFSNKTRVTVFGKLKTNPLHYYVSFYFSGAK